MSVFSVPRKKSESPQARKTYLCGKNKKYFSSFPGSSQPLFFRFDRNIVGHFISQTNIYFFLLPNRILLLFRIVFFLVQQRIGVFASIVFLLFFSVFVPSCDY